MTYRIYRLLAESESTDELSESMRKLLRSGSDLKYLNAVLLENLAFIINLRRYHRIYPEGYGGYSGDISPTKDFRVCLTSRVRFTYVDKGGSEIKGFRGAVYKATVECERLLGACLSNQRPYSDFMKSSCILSILHVYGNIFLNIEEYYRKFLATRYVVEHLARALKNTLSTGCSGIGFNETYEYLKRRRKVLKKEALSRAIREFSSEVEEDEVRSIGTFMRVTPTVKGGTKTI